LDNTRQNKVQENEDPIDPSNRKVAKEKAFQKGNKAIRETEEPKDQKEPIVPNTGEGRHKVP
jgi:hypothetical protein